ncbi:MAG: site-2 protease family protein [Candidatus Omnitrophica bacterium]|nr:site-2 protease family protein [Candidatus Omnitrophota bacterium]
MRGSIRLFSIFGIAINIHITFLLLLVLILPGGLRSLALVIGVFFFVTMHELCHSLVARRFGIEVREITLFPIGGVASMSSIPERPLHELLISLAGPLSNIVVVGLFFYPMRYLLGDAVLFHSLSTATWPLTLGYIYWINLALAAFNIIPAFPMDGGRILRAALATRLGWIRATRIAVNLGHIFALIFAYFGMVRGHLMLVAIAVFIYMAASREEAQAQIKETLKKFKIHDILPSEFSISDYNPAEEETKKKTPPDIQKGML